MLSIREIMTPDLFTLETSVTLAVAKQLMKLTGFGTFLLSM